MRKSFTWAQGLAAIVSSVFSGPHLTFPGTSLLEEERAPWEQRWSTFAISPTVSKFLFSGEQFRWRNTPCCMDGRRHGRWRDIFSIFSRLRCMRLRSRRDVTYHLTVSWIYIFSWPCPWQVQHITRPWPWQVLQLQNKQTKMVKITNLFHFISPNRTKSNKEVCLL